MAQTLTTPADPPGGSPVRPRGVLAVAAPAPEGWELGGISVQQVCPSPIIRDKCITIEGGDPLGRPEAIRFPAFMVEQGSECSTLSGGDREAEARNALNESTDYALGLTLLNGEANNGPSLSDADLVGTGAYDGPVAAVAALEAAAVGAGLGLAHTLHASTSAATYLAAAGLIDDQGRAPSGAQWIISTGYGADEDGAYRIWATARVWAAAGAISTYENVNRRQNNREAWAARSMIVGFNPCINLTATFTPSTGGGMGTPGLSAYEIAVENGFEGDETEWLASLVGPEGPAGVITDVTATGLPAGEDPTVTLGGTPEARTIEIGVPAGAQGVPGVVQTVTSAEVDWEFDATDPSNLVFRNTLN